MKKILPALATLVFLFFSAGAEAQLLKDMLNKKKQEAKEKAANKIDQKTSEGIDAAVNAPEKIIKKKIEAKKNKKEQSASQAGQNMDDNSGSPASSNEFTNGKPNDKGEFIIKTNIKCSAGKKSIENLLRDTEGVNSVSIDVGTGKLYLSAGGDNTIYNSVIDTIRANGFEADGQKPKNAKTNPCK